MKITPARELRHFGTVMTEHTPARQLWPMGKVDERDGLNARVPMC